MRKDRKITQRILQVSLGMGLVFFAFLIEWLAIHPSGIYSYSQKGYQQFDMGLSKPAVLEKINHQKTIRTLQVCDPDRVFSLKSRKGFEMEDSLASADYWICHDRTGKDFLFVFENQVLVRILIQRLRYGKNKGSVLFRQCQSKILNDLDAYLLTRETLKVFYDTPSQATK